jgi:hypothetical protein
MLRSLFEAGGRLALAVRRPAPLNAASLAHTPLTTVRGSNLPGVELPSNGVEACMASRLDVPNGR